MSICRRSSRNRHDAAKIMNETVQASQPMPCVGYAYVPDQIFDEKNIYDFDTGLNKGTIFPCLDLSLMEYGNECKCRGGMS